ncbi:serine/threonine-protein kinase [Streptomyces gilvosporeus]|uniref:Serine/threonine protein kinase n=1 Tax=Streptomyces gilvosporeus TaxID=553510 RepID=A0A1V0TT87_9ACTN|nr:serine/threonine-protein kinase [Streptomyces gilvosporeus]ARF56179.1 serine/threonine protein kinase [Streptomyces gilvosporeus]
MEQPGHAGQQQGRTGRAGGLTPLNAGDPPRIGDYRLIGRLGEGGMGKVFLARSDRGRTLAVKLVRGELAGQEEFRARFRREVRAAQQVGGEWTAPVLDADTEAETPWVATGYIAGPSLAQVVAGGTPLPERTVRILAAGLARALQAIHAAGIVHRDLKPSNVLITIDGPRVIDFGIARALEAVADGMTRTGATLGSPGFMAPEQVRGEPIGPACDVFCLGSVLMYAATGRQPFGTAESGVHALMYRIAQEEPDLATLPAGLHPLVAACLTKDPTQRPTPAQLVAMAEDPLAGVADEDEPWLPGALVARLGRHAIELLEAENPSDTGVHAMPTVATPPAAPHTPPPHHTPPGQHTPPGHYAPPVPPPSPVPQGPAPYAPQGGYGYPPPAQAPAAAPQPPAPMAPRASRRRQRRVGSTLAAVIALVACAAAAVTGYLVLSDDSDGVRAEGAQGKDGRGSAAHEDGRIPAGYLGTWEATGLDGAVHHITLKQGAAGDTVMRMTVTGETYRCRFSAALKKAGPPVRLGPSQVDGGQTPSCSPGSPSILKLVGGRLERSMADGKAPLMYRRTG